MHLLATLPIGSILFTKVVAEVFSGTKCRIVVEVKLRPSSHVFCLSLFSIFLLQTRQYIYLQLCYWFLFYQPCAAERGTGDHVKAILVCVHLLV